MSSIERVIVDECVGQDSPLVGQLRQRFGEQPVKFVFLATKHPGIPDIEILDKLLDVHSALLTQDRVLHNLAIGRGFRSFVHTPESGLTDRRLVHVSAPDRHLPVARGAALDSYRHQSPPEARAITGCLYGFLSAAADGGTISGTSWDAVTIAWDNGQVAPYTMEICAKSTQRRQSQRRVSVLQQCTIPVEIIFGGGSV
jgi:hypothetical protein